MTRGNGHLEWESSKQEQYAERWWTDHGFTWKLKSRFISKSTYEVSKDGIEFECMIPNVGKINMKKFMEGPSGFTKQWEMNKEYLALKAQARAVGLIN